MNRQGQKKQGQKKSAEREIRILFAKARNESARNSDDARNFVRKARRKAMHFNIKLPKETRKKFCRECLSYFTSKNSQIRVKKGFIVLKCLNCNTLSRYKLKN